MKTAETLDYSRVTKRKKNVTIYTVWCKRGHGMDVDGKQDAYSYIAYECIDCVLEDRAFNRKK